jgi:hypothetical protein
MTCENHALKTGLIVYRPMWSKHYLGHSDIATTNVYYSKVDDLHMDYTTKVMDEMLETEKQKALDAQR